MVINERNMFKEDDDSNTSLDTDGYLNQMDDRES